MAVAPLQDSDIVSIPNDDLKPGMDRPPADVVHDEGIIKAWDGLDLYWQSWEPQGGELRGVVALMHGFGEHSARYHHVATMLVRASYAVMAIDARGHGRSAGARGHVEDFDQFPRDLDRLIAETERRWPDQYTVVLGHSNGGLISLHHALMSPGRASAYAVTSPFLGFKVEVPLVKALAGNVMSKIYPKLSLPTELDPGVLSHNEFIVEQYANDPLNLSVATARWFTETKSAQARLLADASSVDAPALFLVSGPDELADSEASEEVYHALGSRDREFELFPDLKHEVLNEEPWATLVHRIIEWYERFR